MKRENETMGGWPSRAGMRRRSLAAGFLVLAVLGLSCTPARSVDMRMLLRRAADNEIALANAYENQRLRVTGRVVDLGYVQDPRNVRGQVDPNGQVTAQQYSRPRPYVTLAPLDNQPGALVCWMRDDDDLVLVRRGVVLRVQGYFYLYDRRGAGAVHLRRCEVPR